MNDIECQDCGLIYQVIWNYDGMEAPVYFCPRCGSEMLKLPTTEEQT